MTDRTFEVWGDPIQHSLSPRLHTVAYRALDRDWGYSRRLVPSEHFADELARQQLDGISLTMPLKGLAAEAAAVRAREVELTGAANTLVRRAEGLYAYNTDIGGIDRAIAHLGIPHADHARIVGAGATATSALVAVAARRVQRVDVYARRPEHAHATLQPIAEALAITLRTHALDAQIEGTAELTISTLPGSAVVDPAAAAALADGGGTLFDVVYGTWPTTLATAWQNAGLPAYDGVEMLVQQAALQIRLFSGGALDAQLPGEAAAIAAMRTAVVGD